MALAAWETKVRERVRKGTRKYGKIFADARGSTEADISGLIFVMFEEVFGYDQVTDISAQYRVKAQLADYVLKVGGKPVILVEIKGPTVRLTQNHLYQASGYAINAGVQWVVLTNGIAWQLFHVSKTVPVEEDPVFECDICLNTTSTTIDSLCALAKEYVVRGEPRRAYEKVQAVRPPNLLRSLYSERVLREMCRSLRASTGYRAEVDELCELINRHLLKPELVGTAKISRKPKANSARETKKAPETAISTPSVET